MELLMFYSFFSSFSGSEWYDWILIPTMIWIYYTKILLDVNKRKRYFVSPSGIALLTIRIHGVIWFEFNGAVGTHDAIGSKLGLYFN